MEGWEGDEVGFVVGFESVDGMTDLFDVDCAGKGCFLGIVTLKLQQAIVSGFGYVGRKGIPERHACRS